MCCFDQMTVVCECEPDVDLEFTLSLFRIHFDKLKNIPVLKLDASVEFQTDPVVQEQFISKVFTTA